MKTVKQTLLLCISIVIATFFGCKTIDEELTESRAKGIQQLDSFLGIKLGSVFPGSNEVTSYTNEWNDNGRLLEHESSLKGSMKVSKWVRLTAEGRVYEINLCATFYYETFLGATFMNFLPWPFSRERRIENAVATCEHELEKLCQILELSYDKPFVWLNSTKSVMPFADDRKIIIIRKGYSFLIRAVDERSAEVSKRLIKHEPFEE